jgi:hypothetical protein
MPIPLPGWLLDNLYEALNRLRLGWPPTDDSLRSAYRRRTLLCHPDRGGSHEDMLLLSDARDVVARALRAGLPAPPPPHGARGRDGFAFRLFRGGFLRSRRGNLWRRWRVPGGDEWTLTVFRRPGGGYGWCVAGPGGGTSFSPGDFSTEEAAMEALWRELADVGGD